METAEITRAECRERARLLRVRSYDAVLDLTREESFGSVSVTRFDCAEPGAIEDIWASSSGHQRVQLGTLLFPYPAASPEFLTMLEEFLAAPSRDPALARMLRDQQDAVQRALNSRALTDCAGPDSDSDLSALGHPRPRHGV